MTLSPGALIVCSFKDRLKKFRVVISADSDSVYVLRHDRTSGKWSKFAFRSATVEDWLAHKGSVWWEVVVQ